MQFLGVKKGPLNRDIFNLEGKDEIEIRPGSSLICYLLLLSELGTRFSSSSSSILLLGFWGMDVRPFPLTGARVF